MPATVQDLKELVNFDVCSSVNLFCNETDVSDRTPSRGSNSSDVPINAANSLVLPIYVYDCPLASLVNSFVNNSGSSNISSKDVYEDHKYRFRTVQEDVVR